jgi:hypothetical protein
MDPAARTKLHPFAAFMDPSRWMLAHNRLTELHLESRVHRPMDGPPLLRTGDASQEAYDAVVESEADARSKAKGRLRARRRRTRRAEK